MEGLDARALLLSTARDPRYASFFNYASMAWNNHFFFKGLVCETVTCFRCPAGLLRSPG